MKRRRRIGILSLASLSHLLYLQVISMKWGGSDFASLVLTEGTLSYPWSISAKFLGSDFAILLLTYYTLRYPWTIEDKSRGPNFTACSMLEEWCLIHGPSLRNSRGTVRFRFLGLHLRHVVLFIDYLREIRGVEFRLLGPYSSQVALCKVLLREIQGVRSSFFHPVVASTWKVHTSE